MSFFHFANALDVILPADAYLIVFATGKQVRAARQPHDLLKLATFSTISLHERLLSQ